MHVKITDGKRFTERNLKNSIYWTYKYPLDIYFESYKLIIYNHFYESKYYSVIIDNKYLNEEYKAFELFNKYRDPRITNYYKMTIDNLLELIFYIQKIEKRIDKLKPFI